MRELTFHLYPLTLIKTAPIFIWHDVFFISTEYMFLFLFLFFILVTCQLFFLKLSNFLGCLFHFSSVMTYRQILFWPITECYFDQSPNVVLTDHRMLFSPITECYFDRSPNVILFDHRMLFDGQKNIKNTKKNIFSWNKKSITESYFDRSPMTEYYHCDTNNSLTCT